MRMILRLLSVALCCLPTAAQARLTVGVAPFVTSASEEYQWVGQALAEALTTRLLNAPEINALTQRQLASAIRHNNIDAARLQQSEVAVDLGRQVGADLLVTGSYTAAWPNLQLVLSIVSPKEAKSKPPVTLNGTLDKLTDLEAAAAKQLGADLGIKLSSTPGGFGTKSLDAWRETTLALQVINWQSLAPRAASPQTPMTLPKEAVEAARTHLENATRADPNFRDAWAALGITLAILGDGKAATAAVDRAQKGGALPAAILAGAFLRMRDGKMEDAAKVLAAGIDKLPGFLHARGSLGELYNHMGRHKEARAVFEDYLKVAPNQPWVLAQLGYTKSKLHDHVGAVSDTIAAVDLLPDSPSLLIELASRYIDAGKLAGAEDALRHALEKFPEEPLVYTRLGYVYLLQGQDELAIPISEKALTLAQDVKRRKDRGYAHLNLARAYGHRGDLDRAFEHLGQAKADGLSSFEEVASDPALQGLRSDPRYAKGGF